MAPLAPLGSHRTGASELSHVASGNLPVGAILAVAALMFSFLYGVGPSGMAFASRAPHANWPSYGPQVAEVGGPGFGVLTTIPIGGGPQALAVDNSSGAVYIPAGSNVTIVNGTSVEESVPGPLLPPGQRWANAGVFDPSNGWVYSFFPWSESAYIMSGDAVIGNVSLGVYECHVAYDSATGSVYVSGSPSGCPGTGIEVLHGMSIAGSASFEMGYNGISGMAYDPADGDMYLMVGMASASYVLVLNGTTVVGNVSLGSAALEPSNATFDPANGYMYVSEEGVSSVAVLSGASLVTTLSVGLGPGGGTYDPATGDLYVINRNWGEPSGSVSVIRGTTVLANVTLSSQPQQAAYDPAAGIVCVLEWLNYSSPGVLAEINGTTLVGTVYLGSAPTYESYDASDGYLDVADAGSNQVTVLGSGDFFDVTFGESGLPSGWGWSMSFNGLNQTFFSRSAGFEVPNGTYPYQLTGVLAPRPGWNASAYLHPSNWSESPLPYKGSVRVAGSSVVEPVMVFTLEKPGSSSAASTLALPVNGTLIMLYGFARWRPRVGSRLIAWGPARRS